MTVPPDCNNVVKSSRRFITVCSLSEDFFDYDALALVISMASSSSSMTGMNKIEDMSLPCLTPVYWSSVSIFQLDSSVMMYTIKYCSILVLRLLPLSSLSKTMQLVNAPPLFRNNY